MRVLPMYPYARALQELAAADRADLRDMAIRAVRDELRSGHDGLGVARAIQHIRMRAQPAQVPACAN